MPAVLAGGCVSSDGEDPDQKAIAEIGGQPILLAEFRPALLRALGGLSQEASDDVKSRLLDQFLDRRVLLEEARLRGINADDAELEQVLSQLADGGEVLDAAYREEVRATLTVERLHRIIVTECCEVTPEEEEDYYREHPEAFQRPAVLVVRQILVDDATQAALLREQLAQSPQEFAQIAQEHSLSPDRGQPHAYSGDDLPREAAQALGALQPGQLSRVIEIPPNYLIFRLEEVRKKRSLPLEEARPRIRARLLEARGDGAMAHLLAELKNKLGLRVFAENLPFQYVQEEPA